MSNLSRVISKLRREMEGIEDGWLQRSWDYIMELCDYPRRWANSIKAFIKNLVWMVPHAWNYRDWDYSGSIDLFVSALEQLAKGIDTDIHVGGKKNARRCKRAARQLNDAYNKSSLDDREMKKWWDMHGADMKDWLRGVRDPKVEAQWERIHKRLDEQTRQQKIEAWAFIHKHIERWWD